MKGKRIRTYEGKCGSCIYFSFICRNGDTREDGRCEKGERVNYHQASQKACKLYKAESEDKCKNCEYYHNPDYTRCHECKAGRSDKK